MDVRLLFTGIILPGGQRIFLTAELPYRLSIISSMNLWLVTIKQIYKCHGSVPEDLTLLNALQKKGVKEIR